MNSDQKEFDKNIWKILLSVPRWRGKAQRVEGRSVRQSPRDANFFLLKDRVFTMLAQMVIRTMRHMNQSSQLNSKFLARVAIPEDAKAIGTIHTESWKTTYKGIVHQSFLDSIDLKKRILGAENRIKNSNTDCLVLVETRNNKVIGFADVGPCREKNVDSDGELYAIYLLQEHQNLGGGKILFKACVSAAKEKGYAKMMVSVLEQNTSSRKFYEKMGGKYIGADHVDIEEFRYPTSTYLWQLI